MNNNLSEVVPIAENGCKVRVVTKSTLQTVHAGHAWRDRLWQYLLTHRWTRGPLTKLDPPSIETDLNRWARNVKAKIPLWEHTSSDLTAATDNLSADYVMVFIEWLEKLLLTPEELEAGEVIPELRVM